jgi:hypothetical protein
MRRKKSYDFDDKPPRPKSPGLVWNILTVIVLLMAACIVGVVLFIALDPQIFINPFPPQPPAPSPTLFQTPTPTATLRPVLPPTWTRTPAPTLTPTPLPPTPTSTITLTAGPTNTLEPGAPTPTPGGMNYALQGAPQLIQAFSHTDCKWMGVGGQVFDLRSGAVVGLIVQAGGSLDGKTFETQTSMAGTATQYGPSGFEFTLATRPIASANSLWIQLIDQSGLPLSDKVYFSTSDKCEQNLVLLAFKQVK